MAFERFEKIGTIFKVKASISNKGVINLSQGACHFFGLTEDNSRFVELYYDKDRRLIGMKFVKEKEGSVATVRYRVSSLDFSAKSLLEYYKIQPERTSLYELKKESDMIVLDLNTAVERKTNKT